MIRDHSTPSPNPPFSLTRVWFRLAPMMFSLLLAPVAVFADEHAAPASNSVTKVVVSAPVASMGAGDPVLVEGSVASADYAPQIIAEEGDNSLGMIYDPSPWGMYKNAGLIAMTVIISLALASTITWTIFIAKGLEVFGAKRRLRAETTNLKKACTLKEASESATEEGTLSHLLVWDALEEMRLSANSREKECIKERVSLRLERLIAAYSRKMSSGTGVLATIGSTAPFVGLFGTVWGIMNSFIGIAKTQTTNLAVVAPGIAEALLATALGLVAAIPAVVIYNFFARYITGYKVQMVDASAEVLLLVSRDLDYLLPERSLQPDIVNAG